MSDIVSDYFARRENILTRLDPRLKMIFVVGALAAVLSSSGWFSPVAATLFVLMGLAATKVPFKMLLFRLAAPLGVALTVLGLEIFLFHQSFAFAILAVSKIIASSSLVLFLSMTTPFDKVLAACSWFRLPSLWVEIALLAYRYLFVLLESTLTILDAQKLRLGYRNIRQGLTSAGILSGAVMIKAYDQSVATHEAMMLRGYSGEMKPLRLENRFLKADWAGAVIFMAILFFLFLPNLAKPPAGGRPTGQVSKVNGSLGFGKTKELSNDAINPQSLRYKFLLKKQEFDASGAH